MKPANVLSAAVEGRVRKKRGDGPIRFRSNFRNTVYDVLRERPGWAETDSEIEWDFQWAERDWVYDSFDTMHLDPWQRMNHYRNGRELCRKDLLAKNIKRIRRGLEKEGKAEDASAYDFSPITFILPGDYALFVEEFKKPAHAGATWIMKPIARSQGKGIFLFNKLTQITQWKSDYRWKPDNAAVEAYVVQKYIANPYLIGGKKFDLRVYALVTNYSPLTVWIYRSGFTRFSASRYSNDPADIFNTYVHLTNVAVQKTSTDYNPDFGGKWEIGKLKMYLASKHGMPATEKLFKDVEHIMLYSLQSVQKMIINDPHCFELYGYDIIIDEDLKPWLLEVNASPSMTASTRDDYDLKYKLLNDTLDIVDMEGRLTGDEARVGGYDLVWKDGPIHGKASAKEPSSMGYDFDRHVNVWKAPSKTEPSKLKTASSTPSASDAITLGAMSPSAPFTASPRSTPKMLTRIDTDVDREKEPDRTGVTSVRTTPRVSSAASMTPIASTSLTRHSSTQSARESSGLPPTTAPAGARRCSSFTTGSTTTVTPTTPSLAPLHTRTAPSNSASDEGLTDRDYGSPSMTTAARLMGRNSSFRTNSLTSRLSATSTYNTGFGTRSPTPK